MRWGLLKVIIKSQLKQCNIKPSANYALLKCQVRRLIRKSANVMDQMFMLQFQNTQRNFEPKIQDGQTKRLDKGQKHCAYHSFKNKCGLRVAKFKTLNERCFYSSMHSTQKCTYLHTLVEKFQQITAGGQSLDVTFQTFG